MRRLRIAWIAVLAVAALAAPVAAQAPDEEIEMEPDPPPAPKPAPPAPKPATPKPPAPAPKDAAPKDAAPAPAPGDAAPAPGDAGDPAAPAAPAAPVKDPKLSKKWLTAGQQLVQKGDRATRAKRADEAKASYENAATAFEKSIEAGEDLNTYALLADVEDKLGKYDLAVKHYRVVTKAQGGIRPDVLKRATAKLDELTLKVGIVALGVKPDGAVITMNGTELGKAPLAEPLILMPGTYTLSFQAEGFQPRETELVIEAGSESERTIELEEVKIVIAPPVKDEEPVEAPKPPPVPSKTPLYIGGGVAVALLGTAAVTGILAVGKHGTYTSADATPAERDSAKSSGQTLALVTDITLATGVVTAGFTAYWYFFKYRPSLGKPAEPRPGAMSAGRARRDAAQSAKLDVIPWVQPQASGLTLVGAF